MQTIIAQATDNGLQQYAPLANMTVVGALIVVVIWMITRGFPRLLERSDEKHADARKEFLQALDKQTDTRAMAAASGHEVASRMEVDLANMANEMRRANDLQVQRFRKPELSPTA